MTKPDTHDQADACPICAVPFEPEDVCAGDVEMGTCHAACLEGSPVVDLDTGDEILEGKVDTYLYREVMEPAASATVHSLPAEAAAHGQIFTPYAVDERAKAATAEETSQKIVDEPHEISTCDGKAFVVFDTASCRVTINGPQALETARELISKFNASFDIASPPPQTHLVGRDTPGYAAAEAAFTEYFVRNYPGPDTVIFDPKWHAPKLFAAAAKAMESQL